MNEIKVLTLKNESFLKNVAELTDKINNELKLIETSQIVSITTCETGIEEDTNVISVFYKANQT